MWKGKAPQHNRVNNGELRRRPTDAETENKHG
jgi:hypothetical protein